MSRTAKLFLYGLLYLAILGLIGVWIYFSYIRPAPTCSDELLNQNEEQIDCGGPCIPCELKDLEFRVGEVRVGGVGVGKTTLVTTIENPSLNYGATEIDYQFDVTSVVGGRLSLVEGTTAIYPGQTRYVVEAGLPINTSDVGEVRFSIDMDEVKFVPLSVLPDYSVVVRQLQTRLTEGGVEVEGLTTNNSPVNTGTIRLVVLLYDTGGQLVNAATTIVNSLGAYQTQDFRVFLPLADISVDPQKTEVFWEVVS